MKILPHSIPVIFIITLTLGFGLMISGVEVGSTGVENRKLSPHPLSKPLHWNDSSGVFDFLKSMVGSVSDRKKDFHSYYKDHFPFKEKVFRGYAVLQEGAFNCNPLPGRVVKGMNNWLFLGDDYSAVIRESKGMKTFTPEETGLLRANLKTLSDYFKSQGVEFYIAVARNKHSVYGDSLPIRKAGPTTLDQFKAVAREVGVSIIDFGDQYSSHTDQRLYHKRDSHWNDWGAFWGYIALMNQLNEKFDSLPLIRRSELLETPAQLAHPGLSRMLNRDTPETYLALRSANAKAVKSPSSAKKITRYFSPAGELKLMMWCDSFGEDIEKFISESFGESVFIFSYKLDPEMIKREKPDIVVQEVVERKFDIYTRQRLILE